MFRFVQAAGAAMMMSTGPAIITHVFATRNLGRVLGLIGVATAAGLMCGPVVSGFLLHHHSWRAIFFVTIPVSSLMCLVGWFFVLPEIKNPALSRKIPFNWKSFLYWSFLVVFLVFLSSNPMSMNMREGHIIWLIPGVILAGLLFIDAERKSESPLLPLSLIKTKYFSVAMITITISFSVLFMVVILIPFYLTFILNLTPIEIGTVMMMLPISLSLVSPVAGRLYDSLGAKKLTTIGLLVCTCAVLLLSILGEGSKSVDVMWRLALLGMGQSIFLSPNSASVLSRVNREYTGITSGILATSRNLGMLFGVALAGMVFGFLFYYFSGGASLNGFESHHIPAFVRSLHFSFVVATCLSLTGAAISAFR